MNDFHIFMDGAQVRRNYCLWLLASANHDEYVELLLHIGKFCSSAAVMQFYYLQATAATAPYNPDSFLA
jgi:hypothetical protein